MKKKKMTRAAVAAHFASIVSIIAIAAMIGFGLSACGGDDDDGGSAKNITLEGSDELPLGATFDLSVAKFTIDGKEVADVTITWAIKDAKGTGATVDGTTLKAN
ncbi:MAG: hypothetical protein FWB95_08640 [Treponema sp.]|nr:hypothetical protein [Treponema sp.]